MTKKPEALSDWRKLVTGELRGKSPDELNWLTPEGIDVKPLYTADDLSSIAHKDNLPGFFPYTRGVR
ncbi:MAG TPA: methylmalonyl-CoA mutase family protein, partial [Emcibacteraceae bacterium]|nr:methylmalonyl-CoA mutase family protein [Emcibacteraceae bacterium]